MAQRIALPIKLIARALADRNTQLGTCSSGSQAYKPLQSDGLQMTTKWGKPSQKLKKKNIRPAE
jgi:hypothetical protein